MELSPDLLANVTFQEQWRGYSPDQVHDFLARVSTGVRDLQARLREAEEKLRTAEARAADLSDADEIRRTLVLAQRTASAAVEEAKAEAAQLVAEAEVAAGETRRAAEAEVEETRRIAFDETAAARADADARAAELIATAEASAGGIVAGAERRLSELELEIARREHEELAGLASRQEALASDVDALEAFAADGRARLEAELRAQLEALEMATLGERPTLSEVSSFALRPDTVGQYSARSTDNDDGPLEASDDEAGVAPEDDIALTGPEADEVVELDEAVELGEAVELDEAVELGEAVDEAASATSALFDDAVDSGSHPVLAGSGGEDEELDWAAPSALSDPVLERSRAELADALREAGALLEPLGDDDPGDDEVVSDRPTNADAWHTRVIADEPDDDPFLSELRRAVTDTEPLGPREHEPTGEVPVIDAPDGSRFRLRRNR